MATTIAESFRQFASNVNITDRQVKTVSNCHTNVVNKIKAQLSLHQNSSRLIGSYARDTMPKYLKDGDVDVMVVMHFANNANYHPNTGASNALQKFRSILSDAYPKTPCGVDRNCVTMKLSEFRLDVIPAFYFDDGSYRIPDTYRNGWVPTRPTDFADHVTAINKNMNGSFVPLIKMIKAWNNRFSTVKIRSFHLECILALMCQQLDKRYPYSALAAYVFSNLPSYLRSPIYEPKSNDRLDEYLDSGSYPSNRETLIKRAEVVAEKAKEAEDNGAFMGGLYSRTAIDQWKAIFGDFFPAYG